MTPKENYGLRQIRVSNQLYAAIKTYCRIHRKTMLEFYKEVLTWFIQHNNQKPISSYQASHKKGRLLSIWLEDDILKVVKKLADQAEVSDARVIYTAIMLFESNSKAFSFVT